MKKILVLIVDAFFVAFFEYLFHKFELFERLEVQLKQQNILLPKFSIFGGTITVLNLIILLMIAAIGYFIFNWFFRKDKTLIRKKNEIKKNNSRVINDVIFQYDVEFDIEDRLYINHLTPYCGRHGNIPIRMVDNYFGGVITCSVQGCPTRIDNPRLSSDGPIVRIENLITSELEQKWRELIR